MKIDNEWFIRSDKTSKHRQVFHGLIFDQATPHGKVQPSMAKAMRTTARRHRGRVLHLLTGPGRTEKTSRATKTPTSMVSPGDQTTPLPVRHGTRPTRRADRNMLRAGRSAEVVQATSALPDCTEAVDASPFVR